MATASTSEVNAELLEKSDGVKVNPQESIVPRLPRRLKSLALLAVTLLVLGDGHFLVLAPGTGSVGRVAARSNVACCSWRPRGLNGPKPCVW